MDPSLEVDLADAASVAAEALAKEFPRQIYIANAAPTQAPTPGGSLVYRWVYWDAYYKGLLIDDPARAPLVKRVLSGIPMNRMGEPDEIVGPILFLASPAASMVTGVGLPVDGGNLALNPGGSHAGLGMKEMIL